MLFIKEVAFIIQNIKTRKEVKIMAKELRSKEIIKFGGVTFVVEGQNVISKWLSKPVYVSLKESNLYNKFMQEKNFNDVKKMLNGKDR